MSDKEKDRSADAWKNWFATLPAWVRAQIDEPPPRPAADDEASFDFERWRAGLSPLAQLAIDDHAAATAAVAANKDLVRYGIVTAPNGGDWPVLQLCQDAETLARRLAELDGSDACAFLFYGIYLPFTRGPLRYILLPDHLTAISVPPVSGMLPQRVELALMPAAEPQDDHYLGCRELSDTYTEKQPPGKPKPPGNAGPTGEAAPVP